MDDHNTAAILAELDQLIANADETLDELVAQWRSHHDIERIRHISYFIRGCFVEQQNYCPAPKLSVLLAAALDRLAR